MSLTCPCPSPSALPAYTSFLVIIAQRKNAEEEEENDEVAEGVAPIHRRRSPAQAGTPRGVARHISGLVYVCP